MITLKDYKEPIAGNNPYLVKGFVDNEIPTEDEFRQALDDKLEKGFITEELHTKAIEQLESLMKAKGKSGEGSKGGHVIGHTKSGKPVYAAGRKASQYDFTPQEHSDAADLHDLKAKKHSNAIGESSIPGIEQSLASHHSEEGKSHRQEAHRKLTKEFSSDEKKILANQKKKQIEHHKKMMHFHRDIAAHIDNQYMSGKNAEEYRQDHQGILDAHTHHTNRAAEHFNKLGDLEKE